MRGKHSLRAYKERDPTWGVAEFDDAGTKKMDRVRAEEARAGLGALLPGVLADTQLYGQVAEPDFHHAEQRLAGMCPGARSVRAEGKRDSRERERERESAIVSKWSRLSTAGGTPPLGYPAGRVV